MKDDQQQCDFRSISSSEIKIGFENLSSSQSTSDNDLSGIFLKQRNENEDLESRLKFIWETHQYVRDCIRLADQKGTFFFAGATALLAYLHKLGLTNKWIIIPLSWELTQVLSFLASVGLIFSAIACLIVVMPRLKGAARGIIFFGSISKYESSKEYITEFMNNNLSDLCQAQLKHVHEISVICRRKYDFLRWGQWLGVLGLVASLLLLVLI